MKVCFKCGAEKPHADFYKHAKMADGYLGKCKECTKTDVKLHRKENDSVREYDRKRGNRQTAEHTRKYRAENPEKYRAHNAVNNAIRGRRLFKPTECEHCKQTKRLEGHHDDYSKPLQVTWLCSLCHRRHHAAHPELED